MTHYCKHHAPQINFYKVYCYNMIPFHFSVFVDTNGVDCINAAFVLGSDSTYNYDIKVEQYSCSNEMAGPPGCLQYFTADMGTIKSFNFNSATGVYGSTSKYKHLISCSFQRYSILRKNFGQRYCMVNRSIERRSFLRSTIMFITVQLL